MASTLAPLYLPSAPLDLEIPSGCTLQLDATTMVFGPKVLAGGAPFKVVRLTEDGAALVEGWLRGTPLSDARAERRLATQLVHAGLLQPTWTLGGTSVDLVTVVIPHRNHYEHLARLLESLDGPRVVVVDDASDDQTRVANLCDDSGVFLVRRTQRGGPSAARNDGIGVATTPFVAFLDADCMATEGWLEPLVAQMCDPRVALVAPRVVGPPSTTHRGKFEEAASPLDLGNQPGLVRPQSARSFVPGAAMLVRTSLGNSLFDTFLDLGEDVDFAWRLSDAGWIVRYEPLSTVQHHMRPALGDWLRQRYRYGTSAAILAERHGAAVAPLQGTPTALAAWGLLGLGHPIVGLAFGAAGLEQLRRRLTPFGEDATAMALTLYQRSVVESGPHLARQVARSYGPLLLLGALASRSLRRFTVGAFFLGALGRWRRAGSTSNVASFVAYSALDDLAYGAGVLWGSLERRSLRALLPRFVRSKRSSTLI